MLYIFIILSSPNIFHSNTTSTKMSLKFLKFFPRHSIFKVNAILFAARETGQRVKLTGLQNMINIGEGEAAI